MNRLTSTALLGALALSLAACGATATGGTAAKASPSPSPRVRNGAQGELVKITGSSLVVNATTGDVVVTYGPSTTFVKTSTASFADIAVGKCMVATGQKDPAGAVTASAVRLTEKVNGACAQGAPGGLGGAGGAPGDAANPQRSPRPGAQRQNPNFAFAAGEVTVVAGTTVTVKTAAGGDQAVSVPTTVAVSRSAVAASSDLALHQCVAANGPRDASGQVAARTIQIVPAGPSGCFSGGGRGFGGFGRGNGGGGGGGAAGASAPPGD